MKGKRYSSLSSKSFNILSPWYDRPQSFYDRPEALQCPQVSYSDFLNSYNFGVPRQPSNGFPNSSGTTDVAGLTYIHSSLNSPQSSHESISADDQSVRASIIPEVKTHDSDAAPTLTEYDTTFSPLRSQQPTSGLSTFESRGRNTPRQNDHINGKLFCARGGYDNVVEVSLSNSSDDQTG